jgi:hypothetical protein
MNMKSSDRSIHARRQAFAVDRALSSAFGELEGAIRLLPEHESELRQMTYDIARMQSRIMEITEGVR